MKPTNGQTAIRRKRGAQAGITLVELVVGMVIMSILTTMMVTGWISLQRSDALTVNATTAQASARDALARISSELRDCQSATGACPFVSIANNECDFYSAYNQPGVSGNGSSFAPTAALRLTRIYISADAHDATRMDVWWQRDTDNSGTFTSADRKVCLARYVVNGTTLAPFSLFTYYDKTLTTLTSLTDPTKVAMVVVRLAVQYDMSTSHPHYIEVDTTLRPRNWGT